MSAAMMGGRLDDTSGKSVDPAAWSEYNERQIESASASKEHLAAITESRVRPGQPERLAVNIEALKLAHRRGVVGFCLT
jgi:hypothetical protein